MIFFPYSLAVVGVSLVAQTVKCLPVTRETQVRYLGWEDPLEKEMATHSSIPAWRILWIEEPGRLQFTGSQRVRHDFASSLHILSGMIVIMWVARLWMDLIFFPFLCFSFLFFLYLYLFNKKYTLLL